MNIILYGLQRCGKTTIGRMVAKKLQWNFIDTDRLIESFYTTKTEKKYSCRQIFFEEGGVIFREIEKQQIASLKRSVRNIIAVGGGSLSDPDNIKIFQSIGTLVYLKTPMDTLWERIQKSGIPAYLDPTDPEKAFYELAKERLPLYEKVAHFTIEAGSLSEQEVVDTILSINTRKVYYGE